MPVRLRLGQNYYSYASLDALDQDMRAYELRVRQLSKQLAMAQRNVETMREGRARLAEEVDRLQAQHNTRRRAARAEKRHGGVETDDGGA